MIRKAYGMIRVNISTNSVIILPLNLSGSQIQRLLSILQDSKIDGLPSPVGVFQPKPRIPEGI